ncbi:hypothetical protein ScPMuIL_007534 [Solemya velum]
MDTGDIPSNINDLITTEVKNAVNNVQRELLTNITTLMDSRLSALQSNIKQSQHDASRSQIAKIEQTLSLTDNYVFKRKGNENQFKHESKVLLKLTEANATLEDTELSFEAVQSAKTKIIEGMNLITDRQKLIKLADSSELGWRVVSEYVANPIADDSDDEKKIFRAQARAERKAKSEKTKNNRQSRRMVPYTNTTKSTAPNKDDAPTWRPGRCFICGKRAHWANDCPDKKKISLENSVIANTQSDILVNQYIDSSRSTFEQVGSGDNLSPVGRLKANVSEWKSITNNVHIIDVIENGYKLPLKTEPNSIILKNNRSAIQNPKFVQKELENLLQKKCISEVHEKPFVVNPLTVAFKNNKPRLVLDCRHLNPHLFKFGHKYEDTKIARDLFQKGDYLFSYDLKSAYHHITIAEIHRTFLGFAYDFQGITRFFVFTVLPFGISTAGYIFSKLLREVIKYFRTNGTRVIMFLDDGLGGDSNFVSSLQTSTEVRHLLNKLGFLIAHEKCQWLPKQIIDWVGYTWNTETGKIHVKACRIEKAENTIRNLCAEISNGKLLLKARFLASVIGQLISMQIVLGDKVRLHTRYLYDSLLGRASWDAPVKISQEAFTELLYWDSSCRKINDRGIDISKVSAGGNFVSDFDIFCDASDVGFGGYFSTQTGVVIEETSGNWTQTEKQKSSTWRELECVRRVLRTYEDCFENKSIIIHSDNTNVSHILKVGLNLRCSVEAAIKESGVRENSELYGLAGRMSSFMVNSRSDNTNKKYFYSFNRWTKFIHAHGFAELPTQPVHVALYIRKLIDQKCSPSVVNAAVYSIKWAHGLHGFIDPTDNPFVKSLLESVKRLNGRPIIKKDPVHCEDLIALCSIYDTSTDLLCVRDLTMILLCFSGFLRFDEVSKFRCRDVRRFESHIQIFISNSKTDQYRQGNEILISEGSSIACPVRMYLRYLSLSGIDTKSDHFPFKPIFRSKGIAKLIYKNKPLSYSAARENFLKRLREVVPNLNLGTHSLRSGGATEAAKSDVNERCIKRHGRWKTDFVKDGYISDTFDKRMSVSQKLGI